ncbi:MAG: peptide deformylase [Gammaproteobacteria bacterium]|nr:peptide deformylase [Gammaproteobacteria bacterium]
MHPLEILEFPDPRLRTVASPVKNITDEIVKFTERLLFTMYDATGIGLAATQVNFHQRIIAIDISETKNKPLILINPIITESAGEIESNEGCLSVPGFYEPVKRFSEIKLEAIGANGESFSFEASELLGICIQHEIDHLDGKLFIDYLSKTKRQLIRKKLKKTNANRPGSK